MIRSLSISFAVLAAVAAPAAGQSVTLSLLTSVDISSTSNSANPQFIGNNPSAIAWNGTNLWVGGYNASAAPATTAITRVGNVLATPTFDPAFGGLTTPAARGITSLAVQGNTLAASLDTGAGNGDSVRAFNITNQAAPTLQWRIGDPAAGNDLTRRGNGTAFDPGFNASGPNQGVAYLSIGSGRRHLLNTTTGAYINGQNAGAIINLNPVSTTWRDLTFDPATGDLYARESNRLTRAVRNGDNTFTGGGSTLIGTFTTASGVDNQNLAFADLTGSGGVDTIFLNDRPSTATTAFANVVKAFDTNGNPLSINYAGFDPTGVNGNGAYDFSFDPTTQTLAISDFATRQVYIFAVNPIPEPASVLGVVGLAAVGLRALRRRAGK